MKRKSIPRIITNRQLNFTLSPVDTYNKKEMPYKLQNYEIDGTWNEHQSIILDCVLDRFFKAIYKQNSSIKEIKHYLSKKIPVIVDWFSPTALGHYSVVVGLDRKNLIYADPQFGRIKKMKVDQFENRWFELDDYPPKNQAKFALREIVVVFPKLEN